MLDPRSRRRMRRRTRDTNAGGTSSSSSSSPPAGTTGRRRRRSSIATIAFLCGAILLLLLLPGVDAFVPTRTTTRISTRPTKRTDPAAFAPLPPSPMIGPPSSSAAAAKKDDGRRRRRPPPPLFALTIDGPEDRRRQSRKQNDPLLSLNLNLDAMAQNAAAPVAEEMLERISALHKEGYYEVSPDIVSYNSVLKAWKEDDNPERALDYLQQMLEQGLAKADVISFNTVILAFAKRGDHTVAKSIVRQMKERDDLPDPDTVTYNALLYALATSDDDGRTEEAEELLYELLDGGLAETVGVDVASFNTVIHAWSQRGSKYNPAAANSAQLLLDRMEELSKAGDDRVTPDVYTYTTVIQAWARCERSLNAEKLLRSMPGKGLVPNRHTYTATMSALAKSGMPERAESILDVMLSQWRKGDESIKPDTVTFSCVMDGWARLSHVDKPHAADRALSLLEKMKALERYGMGPNSRTYTSVLSAVAKSGTWEACEEARSMLSEMEHEAEKAEREKKTKTKAKDPSVVIKPSTIHYNAVLHAYARSPRADKALKASSFLRTMSKHPDVNCRPDTISYNSALMACANAFGNDELKGKSYGIARDLFRTAIRGGPEQGGGGTTLTKATTTTIRPTSTTFAHFCKASRRLIRDKGRRMAALKKAVRLCRQRGMLNKVVVLQAQQACDTDEDWSAVSDELGRYVGRGDKFRPRDVPRKWTNRAGR